MTSRRPPWGEPLHDFLDDWGVHLCAQSRTCGTIESCLTCGTDLCDRLEAEGLLDAHTEVTRAVHERYLAAMR